ncbi:MAG: inner membrane-spanning protein YciB [Pseudomonadota bacterium]
MAKKKKLPSWVKPLLELGPVAVFFAVYVMWRNDTVTLFGAEYGGLVFATLVFTPLILAATGILWALTGKLSSMQVFTAVLIIVFGGLTIWLNDERFIKIKPTIIYGLFAAILFAGAAFGRLFLRALMDDKLPMTEEGWRILTWRTIAFFAFMAVLNEVVWRLFSNDVWVALDTIGQPIMVFAFFIAQMNVFTTYEDEARAKS